ncbi:hypothetical protein EUX98_g8427 [Antrodiella citrinella]|uniref:Monooxygenase n=1 Tax=Antrodiella citrinella TaxID=2447956 RepID=A0A4V3XGF8_9APHY|nr:hypothetical protein EUX98_g8427 [Antrodiella citrinella]
MRLYRWSIVLERETSYFSIIGGGLNNKRRDEFARVLDKYRQDTAPKEYHDRLKPNYAHCRLEFGCKRFVIDSGYYEALHLPNNDLNFDGIKEVTEKGILTRKGEHFEFDVIISATGFVVDQYPIPIRGSDGITVQQYYREHDGPTAYRGTTIPGFPNFFTVQGPNTATGHGSAVFTQRHRFIRYIVKMLDPVIKGLVSSFEVTHEATDVWNERIQKKLETSVWSGCQSWYRVGHTGKNSALWPGPLIEQWWLLRYPEWTHYHAEGADKWKARQIQRRIWRTAGFASIAAAIVWGYLHPQDVLLVMTQGKDLTFSVFH